MTYLQVPPRHRRLSASLPTVRCEPRIAAVLCYLPGGAVVALLLDRRAPHTRFHAAQSLLFSAGVLAILAALSAVPWSPLLSLFGYAVTVFAWLVAVTGWIALLVSAAQGKHIRLPVLGNVADRWAAHS